jgi:hypothetical protein
MMNKENQNYSEICRKKLKEFVDKKELYFTKRCNKSIDIAINLALNKLDSKKERFLFIQEEGGWITYKNYAKSHKLTLVCLKMKNGRILHPELNEAINRSLGNAILIMHSLPGYSFEEDMNEINIVLNEKITKDISRRKVILVNDCCGSIGTNSAKVGDIIVCSFGKAKPLSICEEGSCGGFIAADEFSVYSNSNLEQQELSTKKIHIELLERAENDAVEIIDFQKLSLIIDSLHERLLRWHIKAKEVKKELIKKGFNILNVDKEGFAGGINVLAEFSDEDEKERLINYCKENIIEYTECPRYIRTNSKALSLEIKRLDL